MTYLVLTGEYHADVTYLTAKCNELMGQRDGAQAELAALRDELRQLKIRSQGQSTLIESLNARIEKNGTKFESLVNRNTRLKWQRNGVQLKLTAAEQRNAAVDIEAAAKMLAACMDYPWDHMPEQGRASVREHAKAVIDAAIKPTESGASEAERKEDDEALQRRFDQERADYFNDESGASE